MVDVDVMQDASEIVHYDEMGIPLYVRRGKLSVYPNMRALCHWHEDLEMIYIEGGEMAYDINGSQLLLTAGDCLIVNSRQMHFGYSPKGNDCLFICILFHPDLLQHNKQLYQKYVLPIIENSNIDYLHFTKKNPDTASMAEYMKRIVSEKEKNCEAYEFIVTGLLHFIWQSVYKNCMPLLSATSENTNSDVVLQKKMVSYIYQHYREPLSLDEIASAGNMSRSKCCIIFKKYLQQSPIDFTNTYRLEVARNLLTNTDYHISRIATACGFNHFSYFSKSFLKKFGCTPSEYRDTGLHPN